MVTWGNEDSGEIIALDIPIHVFETKQSFYTPAIQLCIERSLGLSTGSVRFANFQKSAVGTTNFYFSVFLPGFPSTSTEAIASDFNKIKNFFTHCNANSVCCPAVPNSPLLSCFKNQGLPVTNIYYNDQCS
jgi:hypothetical protein